MSVRRLWQLRGGQTLQILVIKHGACCLLLHVDFDVLSSLVRERVARGLRSGSVLARIAIEKGEVRKPLLVDHVDATVKHNGAAANFCDDTAATNVLTRTERNNFNWH